MKFYALRKRMQFAGVKGLVSKHEAYFLFDNALKSFFHIVEIGSFQGYSTLMLAYGSKIGKRFPVIAIDPHAGHCFDNNKNEIIDTYEPFIKNIERFDLKSHVQIKRLPSQQAAIGWDQKISFLWIDGDHSYKGVKSDYELYEPHVVKGGVIAFHDAGLANSCCPGPRKLIEDIEDSKKYKFQYIDRTAWAVKS